MRTLTIELPDVAAAALEAAARSAGIAPEDLVFEAIRVLPIFQTALKQQPEIGLADVLLINLEEK